MSQVDAGARLVDLFRVPESFAFDTHNIDLEFKAIDTRHASMTSGIQNRLARELQFLGRKKRYNDFANAAIEDAMCWPNEHVNPAGQLETRDMLATRASAINLTRDAARIWFTDLTHQISETAQPFGLVVLGDPGIGKSTLFKYLAQQLRPMTSELGVIYSRFETHKYIDKLAAAPPTHDELGEILYFVRYLRAMVLRDVITNDAVYLDHDGIPRIRPGAKWFSNPNEIDRFVANALAHQSFHKDVEPQTIERMKDACLAPNGFDANKLEDIDEGALRRLAEFAVGNRRVAIIFDGLDHLAPQDADFEFKKYALFEILMSQFKPSSIRQPVSLKSSMPYVKAQIIVQRRQTHQDWIRRMHNSGGAWHDLSPRLPVVEVAPPSADVILYKSIPRPGTRYDLGLPVERTYQVLRRIVENASRAIRPLVPSLPLGERTALLGIFDGNLRDEFEFVRRVMLWASEDLVDSRNGAITAKDFIIKLEGADIHKDFERKRYRLTELLLKFDRAVFENLLRVRGAPIEAVGARISPTMWRNGDFTGLVDNIFNYTMAGAHDGACANHCLLMKIRILQFLSATPLDRGERDPRSGAEILAFMRELSYSELSLANLEDALRILRYASLVREHPTPNGDVDERSFGQRLYSITERGHFAANELIFNTSYLEHVFHKTLLPRALVPTDKAEPRDVHVFDWSVNSIVNYYVLANYIDFIESNSQVALGSFAIAQRIRQAMLSSIERVCMLNDPRAGAGPGAAIAAEALERVERLRARWHRIKLVN